MTKLALVLPSSVEPMQQETTDSLKILIAAKINGLSSLQTSSDSTLAPGGYFPTLVVDDRPLFNANAAVRYLFKLDYLKSHQSTHDWFDWVENSSGKFHLPEQLSYLEKRLHDKQPIGDPVDVILFSALFPEFSQAEAAVKFRNYESVRSWFNICGKIPAFAGSVTKFKSFYSRETSMKLKDTVKKFVKQSEPILPKTGERNILITSALPYVNNVPHLGNIIGCVLSADVFARYSRLRGYNTLYICGTDEYGTATETKAIEEGLSCQALCDKYNKLHAEIYKWFDIDFDFFGRTTTPKHTNIAQNIFLKLYEKDLLCADTMMQLFCEKCSRYLADRYVEGVCPYCDFPDARGDQCDGCGKLLNATELKQPRCKLDGNTPVAKESKHMFLDLQILQSKCEDFVGKASEEGYWSSNGKNITYSWLKEGLKPRCITRDLKWGTPVPLEEMSDKVLYVWFDAPIGYLSITANYTDEWEKWWKNPKDVKLFQFMGKDNVPFHTVIFPCTLLGTEEPYTLLHHLSTTEYLNYEGDKFSKSRGIGVFGNNVMESGIDVAIWRYCLLSSRPETNDSTFTWSELGARTNSELLANLGNYINRVLKFIKARYNSVVPETKLEDFDNAFISDIQNLLDQYIASLESVKLRTGLKVIMDVSARANQYLQENKVDNTLFENNRTRCDTVSAVACNVIYLISALIYPYMPSTADNICKQLNVPLRQIPDKFDIDLLNGHRIGTPDHLFKRLDEKVLDQLFMRYGGEKILKKRAEEAAKAKAAAKLKAQTKTK